MVHRVVTHGSTKNQAQERKSRRIRLRTRRSRVDNSDRSSSDPSLEPEPVLPKAMVETGVVENRIPKDISEEIRKELEETNLKLDPSPKRVRFDDIPVIIELEAKPDDYDII